MNDQVIILLALALSAFSILLSLATYLVLNSKIKGLLVGKFRPVLGKPVRIRKRYIVFAVIGDKGFSRDELGELIRRGFRELLGVRATIQADPYLVYYDPSLKRGILRVSHLYKEQAVAALDYVSKRILKNTLLLPLKTTGTIRKARKIMYRYMRELQL